jgi:hypothetical protein
MMLYRTGLLRGLMLGCATALLAHGTYAEGGEAELLARLPKSKHTLQEALDGVRASGGVPISAKLEFEDGKLWLSAYGAKAGLDRCAEKNELFELKGDATVEKWQPEREVFQDKEHLTRASGQLTLMQTTQLTLDVAVAKADAMKKGNVYSAIPVLKDGKTAINVRIRTANGQSLAVAIDGKTQ